MSRTWTNLSGVGLKLTVFHYSFEIDNEQSPVCFLSG